MEQGATKMDIRTDNISAILKSNPVGPSLPLYEDCCQTVEEIAQYKHELSMYGKRRCFITVLIDK